MRKAALLALTALMGLTVAVAPAIADESVTWGPMVVTGVPAAPPPGTAATQKVVPVATIDTPMTAGATAYVYSEMRAYNADQVNLIENEVRCSGAGSQNMVLGENVLPATGDPAHQDITIVTRFLVSARTSGVLKCTQNLRTASTSVSDARETVSGKLRYALTSAPGDVDGGGIQVNLPNGNTPVRTTATTPVLDRTLPPGYTKATVIADVEYHRCAFASLCTANFSTAEFTLTATSSGAAGCESAPVSSTQERVARGVNHAVIPLYTIVMVRPGCTRIHAEVTSTHLDGDVGSVGGAAVGLTDTTGRTGTSPNHTSTMTHLFVVPS